MGYIDGHWQNDPVLAKDNYGAVIAIGVGTDGAVWFRRQVTPNGPWDANWGRLPDEFVTGVLGSYREPAIFDPITSRPSVILSDGKLWIFLRSVRGRILYTRQESGVGEWYQWSSLGGIVEGEDPVVGNPVAVGSDNRIFVFARGRNGDLWWKRQNHSGSDDWWEWQEWACLLSGDPCPFSESVTSAHHLVYVRGLDQQIWVRGHEVSPSANPWTALRCPGDPGALLSGSPVPGPGFVAWRGIDGRYRIKQHIAGSLSRIPDSSCEAWVEFEMAGDPVHYEHSNGHRDIFWRAPDGGLMHRFRSTSGLWNGPLRIADGMLGQPLVNTSQDNRVEIIYRRGTLGELFHIFQTVPFGAFSS